MYTTELEVLLEVQKQFGRASGLSMDETNGGCFYSHSVNGVGCAVGCLVPADVAETWDGNGFIDSISPEETEEYFDPGLIPFLVKTQKWHDNSVSLEHFRQLIARKIAMRVAAWRGEG